MRGASIVDGNFAFERSCAEESSKSRAVEQACSGSVCRAFTPCQAGHVAHDPHEQTGQAQLNVGFWGVLASCGRGITDGHQNQTHRSRLTCLCSWCLMVACLCSSSVFARHSVQEFQVRDWTFGALMQSSPDLCELDVLLVDMTSLTSTGMPICVMSTNIDRVTRFAAFCSSVCAQAVCEWFGRGR